MTLTNANLAGAEKAIAARLGPAAVQALINRRRMAVLLAQCAVGHGVAQSLEWSGE